MKHGFSFLRITAYTLAFSFFIVSCGKEEEPDYYPPNANPEEEQPTTADGWSLIFEDEFDGNLGDWNIWEGGAYNEEIQMYQLEQLSLNDGILRIDAKREAVSGPTTNVDATTKNFEYVSGRIESRRTFGPSANTGEREYRFMARVKLPNGHGMWPAFWTYGDPWPTQGEIDIFEARGGEPEKFLSNLFYGENEGQNQNYDTEANHDMGIDLTADFHTYEMIWKADEIDILFDDEHLHTWKSNAGNNINKFFGKKQKVVFNIAVGGWIFTDRFSSNYADSAFMEVDWVRVYKK